MPRVKGGAAEPRTAPTVDVGHARGDASCMWQGFLVEILRAVFDGVNSLNVTLVGGAVGGQTVAQGDPNANDAKGWKVRLFNSTSELLGRLGAAASIPVVLSTEDKADLASILAKIIAAPATEATIAALLAAVKQLAGFETLTVIDYSGGDQTAIADGSNGIWINTGGTLKVDTWAGATGATFTVVAGLFPLRGIKKIYQTGSATAAGYIGYPPA